jgi:hypothetical protein
MKKHCCKAEEKSPLESLVDIALAKFNDGDEKESCKYNLRKIRVTKSLIVPRECADNNFAQEDSKQSKDTIKWTSYMVGHFVYDYDWYLYLRTNYFRIYIVLTIIGFRSSQLCRKA